MPTVMIPTEFVNVDNIPLSLNGKVDRKALVRNFKRKLSSKDSIIIDQQNSKKIKSIQKLKKDDRDYENCLG